MEYHRNDFIIIYIDGNNAVHIRDMMWIRKAKQNRTTKKKQICMV